MRTRLTGSPMSRTVRPDGRDNDRLRSPRGELVFGFVLDGSAVLDYQGNHSPSSAITFVIPPEKTWRLTA